MSVLFLRHGQEESSGDALTPSGHRQAAHASSVMQEKGFKAERALTATNARCIDTALAFVLAKHIEPHEFLSIGGDFNTVTLSKPRIVLGADEVQDAADVILCHLEIPLDEDVLVVGNESTPAVLAYQFIIRNGGQVDWQQTRANFIELSPASGILVSNDLVAEPYTNDIPYRRIKS